ncbi:MAG: DUF1580 domain-containing protein [Planctomycetota bacterium]
MQSTAPLIDPTDENLLSLAQAAKLICVDGRNPSPITVWRWATRGKRGVKLPAVPLGRGLVTTEAAMRWFSAKLQLATSGHDTSTVESTAAVSDLQDLNAACEEAGI